MSSTFVAAAGGAWAAAARLHSRTRCWPLQRRRSRQGSGWRRARTSRTRRWACRMARARASACQTPRHARASPLFIAALSACLRFGRPGGDLSASDACPCRSERRHPIVHAPLLLPCACSAASPRSCSRDAPRPAMRSSHPPRPSAAAPAARSARRWPSSVRPGGEECCRPTWPPPWAWRTATSSTSSRCGAQPACPRPSPPAHAGPSLWSGSRPGAAAWQAWSWVRSHGAPFRLCLALHTPPSAKPQTEAPCLGACPQLEPAVSACVDPQPRHLAEAQHTVIAPLRGTLGEPEIATKHTPLLLLACWPLLTVVLSARPPWQLLEQRGLVVKHPLTIKRQSGRGGNSHVTTNIVHLTRFAPQGVGKKAMLTVSPPPAAAGPWRTARPASGLLRRLQQPRCCSARPDVCDTYGSVFCHGRPVHGRHFRRLKRQQTRAYLVRRSEALSMRALALSWPLAGCCSVQQRNSHTPLFTLPAAAGRPVAGTWRQRHCAERHASTPGGGRGERAGPPG